MSMRVLWMVMSRFSDVPVLRQQIGPGPATRKRG
jgi:hypothetical protein